MTRAELEKDKRSNREKLAILKKKEAMRAAFLDDLKTLASGEDRWLLFVSTSKKSTVNTQDISISNSKLGGERCTVDEQHLPQYNELVASLATMMNDEFEMEAGESSRFPFENGFVGYKLQKMNPDLSFNAVRLNVSSDIVIRDERKVIILYHMEKCINKALGGTGITPEDLKDYSEGGFGYSDMERRA